MKRAIAVTMSLVVVVALAVGCAKPAAPTKAEKPGEAPKEAPKAEKPFAGKTVRWATIAGFYTDWADKIAEDFTAKTGINVEIVQIDNAVMYEKQGVEMAARTGAYDLVTAESMWKAEWANAGYIVPLDDYIKKSGIEKDIAQFDPVTLRLSGEWKGKIYALPYYTYNQGMFYRGDLFEDPGEKERFKKEYGTELKPPETWDEFYKVAKFFTRKPGDTLKGKKLEKPFYGCGLMAGRFPEVQDEFMAMLWGNGGDVFDKNFNPVVNSDIGVKTLEYYVKLVNECAPPGARTSSYDEVVAQMKEGLIAMTGPFFLDQWANIVQTEDAIPGAKIVPAEAPQKRGYIGAFGIAMTADSKNKDAAWEFLKFLMSKEAQKAFALGGGSTCRRDVLTDPEVVSPANRKKTGHFPALVKVMESQKDVHYSIFDTPAAGKIYEEMMVHCSMAVSGEKTAKEALDMLARRMAELHAPYKNLFQ